MINIFEPKITSNSLNLMNDIVHKNWLGRGEYVERFENALCHYLGVEKKNIHTVASCTDAIFGAMKFFGFPAGSEIIVPSVSFIAVGNAILDAGLVPRVIDIDPNTGNISTEEIKKHLSEKTFAIFITDYGGIPTSVSSIREIVGAKVKIFEDCAGALGSFISDQACGISADFSCWSFDPMKMITTGEGGAIFCADQDIMEAAKEFFFYGLTSSEQTGHDRSKKRANWWEHQITMPGRRSIFSNINAALGLPQLENINLFLSRRAEIRQFYCSVIDEIDDMDYLRQDEPDQVYSNYFFTVITKQRDELAFFLRARGIYSTFKYYPLHKIDLFKNYSADCPSADAFSQQALNIPIHQYLTDGNIEEIAHALKTFRHL